MMSLNILTMMNTMTLMNTVMTESRVTDALPARPGAGARMFWGQAVRVTGRRAALPNREAKSLLALAARSRAVRFAKASAAPLMVIAERGGIRRTLRLRMTDLLDYQALARSAKAAALETRPTGSEAMRSPTVAVTLVVCGDVLPVAKNRLTGVLPLAAAVS